MAFPTHDPVWMDRELVVVWDAAACTGRKVQLVKGDAYPQDGEIIYAAALVGGGRDDEIHAEADAQLLRWQVAHRTHLRLVK